MFWITKCAALWTNGWWLNGMEWTEDGSWVQHIGWWLIAAGIDDLASFSHSLVAFVCYKLWLDGKREVYRDRILNHGFKWMVWHCTPQYLYLSWPARLNIITKVCAVLLLFLFLENGGAICKMDSLPINYKLINSFDGILFIIIVGFVSGIKFWKSQNWCLTDYILQLSKIQPWHDKAYRARDR